MKCIIFGVIVSLENIVPVIKNNRAFSKCDRKSIIVFKINPVSTGYHIRKIQQLTNR